MLKFLKLTIVCPDKEYCQNDVTIRYVEDTDGMCIHAPFQGCDYFNCSENCIKCVQSLNKILFKNQELYKSAVQQKIRP